MKKRKVLVVDDEPEMLGLLKIRLERHQFEVLTAPDANQAVERLQEETPDLLILDIMTPSWGGVDKFGASLGETLKTQEEYKAIPVILISALGDNVSPALAEMMRKADAYFPKPFDAEKLIQKAKELLGDAPRV